MALAVVILFGVDAADDREAVHLLRRVRQQLADMHAGDRRRNRAERPAGVGFGLGVERFELAESAVQENDQHLLLLGFELRRDARLDQPPDDADPRRPGEHVRQHGASRD